MLIHSVNPPHVLSLHVCTADTVVSEEWGVYRRVEKKCLFVAVPTVNAVVWGSPRDSRCASPNSSISMLSHRFFETLQGKPLRRSLVFRFSIPDAWLRDLHVLLPLAYFMTDSV